MSIESRRFAQSASRVDLPALVQSAAFECDDLPAIFRLRQDYCAVSVLEWIEDVPLVGPVNARVGDGAPALSMRD